MSSGIERRQAPLSKSFLNYPLHRHYRYGCRRSRSVEQCAIRENKRLGNGRYAHKIGKIMIWTPWRKLMKLYPRSVSIKRRKYFSQFVEVRSEKHKEYCVATVILNRPPVNSFDIAFTDELTRALKEIENSGKVDALILKSKSPSIFSSGLDLHDLFSQPRSHLELFWQHVQDLWLQLYSSRLPTIAAINGHCLAGGTILAAACDYRVAVEGNYGIGVTAAKIGVIAPPWFLKMLTYVMGQRNTELALQQGRVFTPREATGVGLVDKVCSRDMMDEECWTALEPFLTVSAESRATMKLSLRADLIENFLRSREEDMDNFVKFILKESVQNNLGKYMEQLKSKTKI